MHSLKALIADDNELFGNMCIEYLKQKTNIEVVRFVRDGFEAVNFALLLKPDLVLMDINMPIMSGLEAARQIKKISPATKVVFVSVEEKATFQALGVLLGIDGYVCKGSFEEDFPKVLQELQMFEETPAQRR